MSEKPSIIITSLKQKCPNCGKGDLFVNSNAYKYSTMSDMHEKCSECGTSFTSKEPGFYWGAMYVSYALTSGFIFFNLCWLFYFFGWNLWALILPNALLMVIMAPLNFRISRALWLGMNLRYLNKDGKN